MEDSSFINSVSSKVSNLQESILPDSRMTPMATSSPSSEEQDPTNLWFKRKIKEAEERFDMINQQLNYYEDYITNLLEPVKNLIYYNIYDEKSSVTSILDLFRVPEEEDSGRVTSKKRTRNCSQSSKLTTSRSSRQKTFSTPKKTGRNRIATVTPGANMRTPSRVYRQPKDGESVISMNGSPIFVSRPNFSQVPQMHIPLKDGRVYAIMGEDGLKNEIFPNVDPDTLDRIKQLHQFINDQIISNNSD